MPLTWASPGETDPYAALDARIAEGLPHRERYLQVRADLSAAEREVATLAQSVHTASERLRGAPVRSALDLPRALISGAFLLLRRRPPFPPTRRQQLRHELTERQEALADAVDRRAALRRDLTGAAGAQRALIRVVEQKARRVVAERGEGWEDVQRCLDGQQDAAHDVFERLDEVRDRLRDTRALAWQVHDEIFQSAGRTQGRIADLRAQVELLQTELDSLGPGAPRVRAVPPWPSWDGLLTPSAATEQWAKAVVQDVLDEVARVYRLDSLTATTLMDRATAAEGTLITLMRRPF